MSDLDFIADVIYGLKNEYGLPMTFGRKTSSVNLQTGVKVDTIDSFPIALAIPLAENIREQFVKSISGRREAFLQTGQRQILVDTSDIPVGKSIDPEGFVDYDGGRAEINKVENYKYGLIVTVTQVSGVSPT